MTEKQNGLHFSSGSGLILPFRLDREQAANIFLRHFAADKMVASEFSDAVRKDSFHREYFNAWLLDCRVTTSLSAQCTKRQDNGLLEYLADRTVTTDFSEILANADKAADDFLLRLLEPFSLEDAVTFSDELTQDIDYTEPAFSPEAVFEGFRPEIEQLALQAAENSLQNYTDKKTTGFTHSFSEANAVRLLLPVWVLECEYSGNRHRIFLNGQTGRLAGVPPRSRKKAAALVATSAVIGSAAAQLIWMAVNAIW